MKNCIVIFSLLIVFVMMSCSQDEIQLGLPNQDEFVGLITDASDTRTVMDSDGKILWLAEDNISLIMKTGYHHKYNVSGDVNSNSTTFSYDNSVSSINIGKKLDQHYAVYPYNGGYAVSDDAKTISLDVSNWANQSYVNGSFEDDKAIMTAKSSTTTLPFSNAFSMICAKLNSEVPGSYSISSFEVESKSRALNGSATIDMSEDKPYLVCTGTENNNKINKLTLESPILLEGEDVYLYLLIPAYDYPADDLTIRFGGTDEMNSESFLYEATLPRIVQCFRSKVTTLEKIFAAVDFSGSTGGVE